MRLRFSRRLVAGFAAAAATLAGGALPGALTSAHAGASSYTLSYSDGHVVRWNPCQTIRWKINLNYAPRGALSDVKSAFNRLTNITGMTFAYAGTTSSIPQKNWSDNVSIDTKPHIVVAWARPGTGAGHSTLLPQGAAGYGGWAARSWTTADGQVHPMRILAGFALLNRNTNSLPGGYGAGETRGQLLLHELGHAIGLEHTSAKSQIMYPTLLNRSRTTYGDGDRTGLGKLGHKAGCIN